MLVFLFSSSFSFFLFLFSYLPIIILDAGNEVAEEFRLLPFLSAQRTGIVREHILR